MRAPLRYDRNRNILVHKICTLSSGSLWIAVASACYWDALFKQRSLSINSVTQMWSSLFSHTKKSEHLWSWTCEYVSPKPFQDKLQVIPLK